MKEFELEATDVFVRRSGMSPFIAAFGAYQSRGERVFKRHLGVTELSNDPDALFSLRGYLAALRELQEQFGSPFIRKIGAMIFEKAAFPPGLDSVEKVLSTLNQAYHMNHSAGAEGKIGSYAWTPSGEHRGVLVCDNPYPCALDLGILESAVERFAEGGKVVHDEGGPCRYKGGDSCSYLVEW